MRKKEFQILQERSKDLLKQEMNFVYLSASGDLTMEQRKTWDMITAERQTVDAKLVARSTLKKRHSIWAIFA